jgi:uncharacterized surface protein with fasciclin (FAS1) repeats
MKSNNVLKLMAMLFSLMALLVFTGCNSDDDGDDPDPDPDPDPTETIMELVTNTAGLDSLEKYLNVYPNLVGLLSADGDNTFFAPNNAAFISLLATPGFPEDIRSINPKIVEGVLAYHISSTRYESADLTSGASVTTLQTESIVVNDDGTLFTGSSNDAITISEADLQATNGVMHITGSVLIPPSVGAQLTPILGTNAGTLLLGANFSDLARVIGRADTFAITSQIPPISAMLADTAAASVHTVFAPTNETFDAIVAGVNDTSSVTFTKEMVVQLYSGQDWYGILLNHIVFGSVGIEDLTGADAQTTGVKFNSALNINPDPTGTAVYNELYFFYNEGAANHGIGLLIDSNRESANFNPTDPTTYAIFDGEVVKPASAEPLTIAANGRVHVIAGLLAPN